MGFCMTLPFIPFVILAIEDDDDRRFMTEFYLKYHRLMYSEATKILRGQCDAEDVVQASLLKLIERTSRLRAMEVRKRVNYMITTVRHTAISALRELRRGKVTSIEDEDWDWISGLQLHSGAAMEEIVFRKENVGQLRAVWDMLDKRSQYLLQARYFLELSQEEIAAELHIQPDSVRMLMSRARKKVRELLSEEYGMVDLWT